MKICNKEEDERLEKACNQATILTVAYCKYKEKQCYEIREDNCEYFTDYAQDIFNEFYDGNYKKEDFKIIL